MVGRMMGEDVDDSKSGSATVQPIRPKWLKTPEAIADAARKAARKAKTKY